MERIWLSPPHMGGTEIKLVEDAFAQNWISPAGPHLAGFEKAIADYNGGGYVAALSSGTAAIHLALQLMNVEAGDDVICSTFTFSGSCNPIAYVGATPVFVDSEPSTWNMDPVLLEEAILSRKKSRGKLPKVIIVVHLYGMPAKMEEICKVASKYEIPIIEDAAEALGASLNNRKAGTFGDIGIFSFNGNKIITTSGGGAMISRNEKWIAKAKFLATQARDPAPHYQHSEIGYNYRLSNVCAAIGLGQMSHLPDFVLKRRAIFDFYKNRLANLGLSFLPEPEGHYSNRWLTTVLLPAGIAHESMRQYLETDQIESRSLWKPMHQQPVFRDCPSFNLGIADKLFENGLCLPSGSAMTIQQLERVSAMIEKSIRVTLGR